MACGKKKRLGSISYCRRAITLTKMANRHDTIEMGSSDPNINMDDSGSNKYDISVFFYYPCAKRVQTLVGVVRLNILIYVSAEDLVLNWMSLEMSQYRSQELKQEIFKNQQNIALFLEQQ